MSLTVVYHTDSISNYKKWNLTESNHDEYTYMYVEKMSVGKRIQIIFKMVVKGLLTLGGYFLCSRCTNAHIDITNLRKRVILHYFEKMDPEDILVNQIGQQHIIKDDEVKKHQSRLADNFVDISPKRSEQEKKLIIKNWFDKAEEFRRLHQNIKEIIESKRNYLLDQLHEKNPEMSHALEKFLNLYEGQQDCERFIRLLSPFIKSEKLTALLKETIERAKNMQDEGRTRHHDDFEKFREAYDLLEERELDWLISIKDHKPLFNFVEAVLSLGSQYSPRFKDYCKNNLLDECLNSMHKKIPVDEKIKTSLEKNFEKCQQAVNEIQKNLVYQVAEETYDVIFTLEDHFKKNLDDAGYDQDFQVAVNDLLSCAFIRYHESKEAERIYNKILEIINLYQLNKKAIDDECLHKINQARLLKEVAKKNVGLKETERAFELLKEIHINQDLRDAVIKLVDVAPLMQMDKSLDYNAQFYDFFRVLKNSEFFRLGLGAVCDEQFYEEFYKYFKKVKTNLTILKKSLML